MTESLMSEAALSYAARGWQVFPCWWPTSTGCACGRGEECERAGKHPLARLAPNGLLDATTDPAIIRGWWAQYPQANIAIRCGAESGLVVLDVDAYKTGLDSLDVLEQRHGRLPYSVRARTGSGGGSVHILLGHPRDGRRISSNSSGKLGPGLDVKADGGYIIAAPSAHASGGRYEWLDEDDSTVDQAPGWLISLLGQTGDPKAPIHTGIELDERRAEPLCAKLFERASARVHAGSARHDTAVWLWTQMKDNAVPIEVARAWADPYLDLCREEGGQRPVTDHEIKSVIGWAYSQPRRDPFPSVAASLVPTSSLVPNSRDEVSAPPAGAAPDAFPWVDLTSFRAELQTIIATSAPTGIGSLDKALNGGLPGGVVVTFVGHPGSCKSALAMQIGIGRARMNGGRLYIYAPDQGAFQPLSRLADVHGDIATDDAAFQRFLAEVGPVLRVADERETGVTMEAFADAVIAAGDAAAVLVDTPQTVATSADVEERQRINLAMDISRRIAAKLLIPVFCPSHANRASTAAKKKEDRLHPRASALGSAGVEHRSQVLAYMEKVDRKDDVTEIEVTITKALGVTGRIFRLVLDPSSWALREVDRAAAEEAESDAAETQRRKLLEPAKDKIRKVLKVNPDGLSSKALEERCGGRATVHRAARLEMADGGELITEERHGKGGGLAWKLPLRRSE